MGETHVVIGGGALGRSVLDNLSDTEHSLRLVNRSDVASVPEGVAFHQADVRDEEAAIAACADATVVYDCVGLPYTEWKRDFPAVTEGILRGVDAARGRLVVADNLYAYGPTDGPLTERQPAAATDTKGRVRAERARTYLENDDVPVVIGRASDFFGPGVIDTAPLVDPFGAALRGDRVSALGALDEPHSFCYLPDFAAALVTLGNHEQAFGGVWHVPHPRAVTVGEFLTMVFDAAGTDCDVRTAPWFIEALLGVVNADVRELRAINHQFTQPFVVDDSKFTETFDVTPTSLSEAIETTLAWHRSERSDSVAQ